MASLTAHAVQALATESTAEFVGDGVSPGALSWLTHMVYGVLTWVTITVPTQVYSFLSLTVTLTFHFKTILIAAALFLAAVYGLVRYYFLTVYSRLPKPPAAPDGAHEAFDLHPDSFLDEDHVDTDEPGPKSGSFPHDFLSVFLSSIQIFGYLEQPVFHELARHLQTRRLLAGETMFYDDHEDRSFYMVVDGSVQVYLKPEPHRVAPRTRSFRPTLFPDAAPAAEIPAPDLSHSGTASYEDLSGAVPAPALGTDDPLVAEVPPDHLARESSQTEAAEDYLSGPDVSPSDSEDDAHTDPFDRHQLLTEVNAGQTLSSLFTILSLLTDNVPLRHRSTDAAPSRVASTASLATEASGITTSRPVDPFFPGLRTEATQLPTDDPARPVRPVGASRAVHPDIIARASVDTTLAVIPVEAFHRLNKKYPNASAHIVQVILTRLQRATFMILHNYLGAHQELHALERAIMQSCHYRVPPALASALSLNHLRAHFLQARVTTDLIPGATFTRNSKVAPHASRTPALRSRFNAAHQNSGTGVPSTPAAYATGYCGRAGLSGLYTPTTTTVAPTAPTEFPFHLPGRTQPPMPFSEFEKGLADASRGAATTSGPAPDFLAEPLTLQAENFSGREAFDAVKDLVLESMFLSLGLSRVPTVAGPPARTMSPMNPSSHLAWRTAAGAPKSPLRLSTGPVSHPARFTLGHSPYAPEGEPSDSDSGASTPSIRGPGPDLRRELELLYLPKGTSLIQQHEHAPGIFFVIDGMLGAFQDAPNTGKPQDTAGNKSPKAGAATRRGPEPFSPMNPTTPGAGGYPTGIPPRSTRHSRFSAAANADPASAHATPPAAARSRPPPPLFNIKPGGLAGYLSVISDYPSFVHVTTLCDSVVGFIPRKALERILDQHPAILLTMAKRLVTRLSPLVLYIDYAIDWGQANPGQVVYREGAPADAIHVVLNGRLRAIRRKPKPDSGFDVMLEFGQGESIGELEVLSDTPRRFTLHAIRATEYVRLPKMLFNALATRHPEITFQIARLLALRTNQLVQHQLDPHPSALPSLSPGLGSAGLSVLALGKNNVNLKTVGILPIHRTVPVAEFAAHLREALMGIGTSTALLNSTTASTVLGRRAFSRMGRLKFMSWLAEQEQKHQLILYLADGGTNSAWTQQCIRQADCILLVGLGEGDPSVGEYERLLVSMKTTARKELVLLHENRHCAKGTTRSWLKHRLWIHAHHHVQMALPGLAHLNPAATAFHHPHAGGVQLRYALSTIKVRFKKYYSRFIPETPPTPSAYLGHRSDFSRLARRLCGKSVGLVLGGGGARGIAHIGVIRALEEAGIPIDLVGGTSIGAFVGGLYARDSDTWAILGWARMFSARMSSLWRQVLDLTYPVTSYVTGHEFNRSIWKVFGDHQIEDMWLPYYCITANITFSREEVHQTGYLWRYVRASMSLSGFLPPLCDNGNMLLDGGYLDNLPVQVMKSLGARTIFAVDVAAEDDTSPMDFGDAVSGWRILINRWNPFATTKIPSLAEVQSRLAYVSSVKQLEEAKTTPGCIYVKPPVQQFGVLQFGSFDEILKVGYFHGKRCTEQWEEEGLLDQWRPTNQPQTAHVKLSRRNSV